jgi:uncharacterized short protein YbdD (DUF466 family)
MTAAVAAVAAAWRACWRALRALSGDDAYDRYRNHHLVNHPEVPLLSRKAFYVGEQQRKWGTINRCC